MHRTFSEILKPLRFYFIYPVGFVGFLKKFCLKNSFLTRQASDLKHEKTDLKRWYEKLMA